MGRSRTVGHEVCYTFLRKKFKTCFNYSFAFKLGIAISFSGIDDFHDFV